MSDLISRQAAIDALERAKQNIHHNIERAIGDAVCGILDEVENGIKQLPPIQPNLLQPWEILAAQSVLSLPEPHWIPVTERLPENGRQVLVYARSVHYALAKYDEMLNADDTYKKQWVTFDAWKPYYTIKDVIAWMPLPEPFNGVTE